MNFIEAIGSGFRNYVNFSGRACRSEYWYWALFTLLLSLVAGIIDHVVFGSGFGGGISPLSAIVSIGTFLPSLAVGVRRLHDIDRTGWWLLIVLTVIGGILLIVWACFKGTSGANRFGPDPLGHRATT
jgi:uncharacterized membrane protein YhaH (DUF805 family)